MVMSPELQNRVFEVHPELCFWSIMQQPMTHNKKKGDGYTERRDILTKLLGFQLPARSDVKRLLKGDGRGVQPDDVLDAAIAAYTSHLAQIEKVRRLPYSPESDLKGLRMEMIY